MNDMKDDFEAAFEAVEKEDKQDAEGQTPDTSGTSKEEGAEAGESRKEQGEEDNAARSGRDEKGRFKKRESGSGEEEPNPKELEDSASAANAAAAQQVADQARQQVSQEATTSLRPPVSWKPAVREHWSKIPAEAQQEILRRETEINQRLQADAEAARVSRSYEEAAAPYAAFLAAERATPLDAFKSLLQTGAVLRVGTAAQKAALVADTIKRYSVDIAMLDSMLVGEAPNNPVSMLEPVIEKKLEPINRFIQEISQLRTQREQQTVEQQQEMLEKFAADPKNEFFEDVRDDMADILEMAAKRGRNMTLEQAYEQACKLNPDVSEALARKSKSQDLLKAAEAAKKAKNAGSSVAGSPSSGTKVQPSKTSSVEEDIAAAMDKVGFGG